MRWLFVYIVTCTFCYGCKDANIHNNYPEDNYSESGSVYSNESKADWYENKT